MMGWRGTDSNEMETDDGEEERARESFDNGISVEGEFAFTKAVGNFCREAVREGRYRGNYKFNLKEQMEQKAKAEIVKEDSGKVRVLLVGGSQLGRIGKEVEKVAKGKIEVGALVKTYGMVETTETMPTLRELVRKGEQFDAVVISGPGNSLVEHGREENRGFKPERKVKVKTDLTKGVQEWEVTYHMTSPRKIPMCERRVVVDKVSSMVAEVRSLFPDALVAYMTMFPRFV
jgi:hypothetical protein